MRLFLQVWLPALSDCPKTLGTVGFQSPYTLQPELPFPGGCVTPRSSHVPQGRQRNLNRFHIPFPSRVRVSTRLTLIRLTLFRKPWVFGVNVSTLIVVTYAYIFFSSRSSKSHDSPSRLTGMLPYRCIINTSHSFGGSLNARSSSTRLRSTSELLRTL